MNSGFTIRAAISPTLRTDIIATRNAVFRVEWRKEHVAMGSNGGFVSIVSTRCKSHGSRGELMSGYRACMPFRKRLVIGCTNTVALSTAVWKVVIAAR